LLAKGNAQLAWTVTINAMRQVNPRIIDDILRYIESNPAASDTAQGIAKWWLEDKYPLSEVMEALAALVAEGLLVRRGGMNSQSVYKSKNSP
jgi:hypothetical protein